MIVYVMRISVCVGGSSHLEDELGNLKLSLEKQKQEQEQQEQARSDRDARASAFVARERLDKEILEARIEVLEEHNVRLMAQLQKLRQLLQHVDHTLEVCCYEAIIVFVITYSVSGSHLQLLLHKVLYCVVVHSH